MEQTKTSPEFFQQAKAKAEFAQLYRTANPPQAVCDMMRCLLCLVELRKPDGHMELWNWVQVKQRMGTASGFVSQLNEFQRDLEAGKLKFRERGLSKIHGACHCADYNPDIMTKKAVGMGTVMEYMRYCTTYFAENGGQYFDEQPAS